MAELRDEALLLRRIPYRDTSLILHLLTRHHGRIALMARGARRAKSPLRAALAPLHRLEIIWRPGRTGMGTLIDVRRDELLSGSADTLTGLEVLAVAAGLFREGDSHGFEELAGSLRLLDGQPSDLGRCIACWSLLQQSGLVGALDHCWQCGRQVADGDRLHWQDGELHCGNCGGGMSVSAGLRKGISGIFESSNVRLGERSVSEWWQMIQDALRSHGICWQHQANTGG